MATRRFGPVRARARVCDDEECEFEQVGVDDPVIAGSIIDKVKILSKQSVLGSPQQVRSGEKTEATIERWERRVMNRS
jgi:hypothetical protein